MRFVGMKMEYTALKDIGRITMGQSPDSSSYNEDNEGLPFFQGNADFGELYPTERVWCSDPKKIAEPGDILISVRAPIGALNYAKDRCCIGRCLAAITINDVAERNYVFHLLKAKNSELNNMGTGSTFKAIGKTVLEEVLVPQITREEQQKYMDMMDVLESIIRERKTQIAFLDNLIKARFVEMFGDPINNTNSYPICSLNDVCTKITDGTHDTPERYSEGYLLITGKNIRESGIIYDEVEYVSEEDHKAIYERCNPEYGDVLYTNIGVNYGTACLNDIDFEFSMKNVALLKPDHSLINGYYLWICLNMMRKYILSMNQTGGAQTFMGLATIKKIRIPIPPVAQQDEFINVIMQIDKSKDAVKKSLAETQLLFDSLMQKYFG